MTGSFRVTTFVSALIVLVFCSDAQADYQPDDYKNLQAALKSGYRIYQHGTNPTVPAVTTRLKRQGVQATALGVRKWDPLTNKYSEVEWFVLVPARKR